jgi:hydrogenase maturation protease
LVAGIGNIFFRDDGFGPAVAAALLADSESPVPAGVRVTDYGIRGLHLSFDLLEDVRALVLIDTIPASSARQSPEDTVEGGLRGPGSVRVLQVGPEDLGAGEVDAHAMAPVSVLASLAALGGQLPPTYVVGCVPADLSDGIGLSEPVHAAVAPAVAIVHDLVNTLIQDYLLSGPAHSALTRSGRE